MAVKRNKRESHEVDKLVAEVDRLHDEKGMSINKACAKVGLQNTVYYFRKRKEQALNRDPGIVPSFSTGNPFTGSLSSDVGELMKRYIELEAELQAVKQKIANVMVSSKS